MIRSRASRGFSLVELLTVLTIVSVLVRLSLPAVASYRRQAVAAQVMNDFHVVRGAAYAQFEATGRFPPEAAPGALPEGAASFLPGGFSFRKPAYELDWDHVALADSADAAGFVAMLTVSVPDSLLGHTLLRKLGAGTTHWSVGTSHTFVIASSLNP